MFNIMDIRGIGRFLFLFLLFYHVIADVYNLEEKFKVKDFKIEFRVTKRASTGHLRFEGFPEGVNNMSFELHISNNYGIVFSLEYMHLHHNCDNYIEFNNSRMTNRFCRSTFNKNREIDSLILLDTPVTLNIMKKSHAHSPIFDLRYTVIKKHSCDNSTSFRCQSGHCIWDTLVCDGYNNCGDNSDEIDKATKEKCPPAHYEAWDVKSILVLLCVILIPISMLALCIIIACCANKFW